MDFNVNDFFSAYPSLSEGAQKGVLKAIEGIFGSVKNRVNSSPKNQLKLFEEIFNKRNLDHFDKALKKYYDQKLLTNDYPDSAEIQELVSSITGNVFRSFLESANQDNKNWQGGSRKDEKDFYNDDHWWDTFCNYLKQRHEPWRSKLLAEALKVKVMCNEYVNYTTLWKIATLPPHSWIDLTQFLSLAGEIRVNDKYFMTVIPGAFSKVSQLEYEVSKGKRRLISDLDTCLTEDGLTRTESGPIVLNKNDRNTFVLNGKFYEIIADENYVDPLVDDGDLIQENGLEDKIRFYGIWLSYVGEEIIQLNHERHVHHEAEKIFELCKKELEEDGVSIVKTNI